MIIVQLVLKCNHSTNKIDIFNHKTNDVEDDGDRYIVDGWDVFKQNIGKIIKSDGTYTLNLIDPIDEEIKERLSYMIDEMKKEINQVIKMYNDLMDSLNELENKQ